MTDATATRPRDFIAVLDDPDAPRLSRRGEGAELLRTLIVHVFYADAHIDDAEIQLLSRLLPGGDVRAYIEHAAQRELDLDRLAALFPDPADRDDIVTLAEHAVWGDNRAEHSEWDIIDRLVEKLGVQRA